LRCYFSRGDIECHLEGHYPFVIAHTGSCARPKSSHRFQFPLSMGLRRLLPIPAGRWPFPTLSLRVFPWMLGPVSRWLAEVHVPVTSFRNIDLPRLGHGSACQDDPLSDF
jgi:hypothetical protein